MQNRTVSLRRRKTFRHRRDSRNGNQRERCVATRSISARFASHLIVRTSLTGSELRVVIEAGLVQNNPSITGRADNGVSVAFSQWALWDSTITNHLDDRFSTLLLGLDRA